MEVFLKLQSFVNPLCGFGHVVHAVCSSRESVPLGFPCKDSLSRLCPLCRPRECGDAQGTRSLAAPSQGLSVGGSTQHGAPGMGGLYSGVSHPQSHPQAEALLSLLLPPLPPITGDRSSLLWAGSLSTSPWLLTFVLLACFSPNLLHMSSVLVSASGRTHTYH